MSDNYTVFWRGRVEPGQVIFVEVATNLQAQIADVTFQAPIGVTVLDCYYMGQRLMTAREKYPPSLGFFIEWLKREGPTLAPTVPIDIRLQSDVTGEIELAFVLRPALDSQHFDPRQVWRTGVYGAQNGGPAVLGSPWIQCMMRDSAIHASEGWADPNAARCKLSIGHDGPHRFVE